MGFIIFLDWGKTLYSKKKVDKKHSHPKTGIGTLGGWNGKHWLGWVDFDAKDFESPDACDAAINDWRDRYPQLLTSSPSFYDGDSLPVEQFKLLVL